MPSVSLTPIAYTMRVHADGDGYGDPYDGVATIVARGDTAEVIGMILRDGDFTKKHWLAMLQALGDAGFEWAQWDRRQDGAVRPVRVRTR